MKKETTYINHAIRNDCSECKYGQDGYYCLWLYFCKCKKKNKKYIDIDGNKYCNKFKIKRSVKSND